MVRSGPPSPANILVGSSPSLLKGNKPAVNGNSPGTVSWFDHLMISPQLESLGKATLGILEKESDSVLVATFNSFPLTLKVKKSFW